MIRLIFGTALSLAATGVLAAPPCTDEDAIWANDDTPDRRVIFYHHDDESISFGRVYIEEWRNSRLAWRQHGQATCSNGASVCYVFMETNEGSTVNTVNEANIPEIDAVIEKIDADDDGLSEWVILAALRQRTYYNDGARVEWFNGFSIGDESPRYILPENIYRFLSCKGAEWETSSVDGAGEASSGKNRQAQIRTRLQCGTPSCWAARDKKIKEAARTASVRAREARLDRINGYELYSLCVGFPERPAHIEPPRRPGRPPIQPPVLRRTHPDEWDAELQNMRDQCRRYVRDFLVAIERVEIPNRRSSLGKWQICLSDSEAPLTNVVDTVNQGLLRLGNPDTPGPRSKALMAWLHDQEASSLVAEALAEAFPCR